ncbi:MAG: hypothetical protein HKN25_17970, partial [Pyrinomonadaceae bacterium]|nr:hypothetical protein [Pyrinomonadaceae bacterium]
GISDNLDIWDTADGKLVKSLRPRSIEVGIKYAGFSPDESLLAVAEYMGRVKLINAETFEQIGMLGKQSEDTDSIVFSPDGTTLLTIGGDGNIRFWETKTGKLIRTLDNSNNAVYSVDFASSHKRLAIVVDEDLPGFFDLSERRTLKRFRANFEPPSSVVFSDDGNLQFVRSLVVPDDETADNKAIITVLGGNADQRVSTLMVGRHLASMDISKNGLLVVSANSDREIMVWETTTGKLLHKVTYSDVRVPYSSEVRVAVSADGKWLAASGAGQTKILILNTDTGKNFEFEIEKMIESLKFAADNRTLAALEEEVEVYRFDDVVLFDVVARKRIRKLENDEGVSKDSVSKDKTRFDLVSNVAPKPVELCFSPEGKFFARNYGGDQIKIWNTATGKQVNYESLPDWLKFKGSFVLTEINDRKILIESYGDKIGFSNANTKKELASLFIYGGEDWAVSTPDGRFDATDGALERIHFTDGTKILFGNVYKSKAFHRGLLQEVLGFKTAREN